MNKLLIMLLVLISFRSSAQIYLDDQLPDTNFRYNFEDFVKKDPFYSYNPETISYSDYNQNVKNINLRYIFDLFANITHINPVVSNVSLNIYKPGSKIAKAFSYIDVKLEKDNFFDAESWFTFYDKCFNDFFEHLDISTKASKKSKNKVTTFYDKKNNINFYVYFSVENNKNYIQVLFNEKDLKLEQIISEQNLASNQ
jgi:hypothetical protein